MAQKASGKYWHKCLSLLEILCFFQVHSPLRHGTFRHISRKRLPHFMREFVANRSIHTLDTLSRMAFSLNGMTDKRLHKRELIA